MLAGDQVALRDLLVGHQPDRDASSVVAVVGFGHYRIADAPRGAHRLALALHQFLARHRQTERGEDLVGFFLVAGKLDGDVRGTARHRGLDALLVLAVAELHQRLVVQAQPRDAALLGRRDQRCRGGSQCTALREADELVARLRPAPALRHGVLRPQLLRQQRAQQPQRQFAGGDALVALLVLIDHGIDARPAGASRLAEGHLLAGDVLQFQRDVLQYVAQPRPLVLAHAPEEAAGLAIRAAVLGKPGQRLGERVDERRSEAPGRPAFQLAQIQFEADDRKSRVERWADVNGTVDDAHGLPARQSFVGITGCR